MNSSQASVRDLRVIPHDLVKKADTALREQIEQATAKDDRRSRMVVGMCVESMVQHVLLPQEDAAGAQSLLHQHEPKLQKKTCEVRLATAPSRDRHVSALCVCPWRQRRGQKRAWLPLRLSRGVASG